MHTSSEVFPTWASLWLRPWWASSPGRAPSGPSLGPTSSAGVVPMPPPPGASPRRWRGEEGKLKGMGVGVYVFFFLLKFGKVEKSCFRCFLIRPLWFTSLFQWETHLAESYFFWIYVLFWRFLFPFTSHCPSFGSKDFLVPFGRLILNGPAVLPLAAQQFRCVRMRQCEIARFQGT